MFSYRVPLARVLCALGLLTCAAAIPAAGEPPTAALYLHMSWSKSEAAIRRIIPAARQWGYDALVLEIGGNVVLNAQERIGSGWTKDDIRSLLALARENDMQVIPCTDLLGHTECAPRMPKFVDKSYGLKLWEPGVYDFIERFIAEVCDLFGKPAYFHARMDEATKAIQVNSERLKVSSSELLARHITRVNEIVRKQGASLIVYHDMMLPAEQVQIGTASGGPPLNSWQAVESIPKDVIINFWLYQFLPTHAPGVDFFTRRGFETWVSPWLSPEPMSKWAAEQNIPLIQTTWCDPTSLALHEANLRAVVMGPAYRLDPRLPDRYELDFDPVLRGVRALTLPILESAGPLTQLALPEADLPDEIAADLPDTVSFGDSAVSLKPVLLHAPRESLDARLTAAKLPLTIVRTDGQERILDGVNRGRGEAEIILYTPAFGPHPNTNMFGTEAVIVNGIVQGRAGDSWSGCGFIIPPGGCVISGHSSRDVPGFMSQFRIHGEVRLLDADGANLFQAPPDDAALTEGLRVPVSLERPVGEIWLLHATINQLATTGSEGGSRLPLVGRVEAHGGAESHTFDIRSRTDVASWRVPRWLLDGNGNPSPNSTLAWADDRGYADVRCLYATRLVLDEPQSLDSLELKPTIAGEAAGWLIAAVAVAQ